jgi:hypothetical protein
MAGLSLAGTEHPLRGELGCRPSSAPLPGAGTDGSGPLPAGVIVKGCQIERKYALSREQKTTCLLIP